MHTKQLVWMPLKFDWTFLTWFQKSIVILLHYCYAGCWKNDNRNYKIGNNGIYYTPSRRPRKLALAPYTDKSIASKIVKYLYGRLQTSTKIREGIGRFTVPPSSRKWGALQSHEGEMCVHLKYSRTLKLIGG